MAVRSCPVKGSVCAFFTLKFLPMFFFFIATRVPQRHAANEAVPNQLRNACRHACLLSCLVMSSLSCV